MFDKIMQDISKQNSTTIQLDIPARIQWQNDNGYCYQTALQSCCLYFGSYVSQNMVRIIAGSQLLIARSQILSENLQDNDLPTFEKFKLTFEFWDNKQQQPQYKEHLQWIKTHLKQQHPVIITGYDPLGKYQHYDHIFLAIGVSSTHYQNYHDNDILIYTDLQKPNYVKTRFGDIWDTREMCGNGKKLGFAIQKDINYGVAITGIQDPLGIFLPITLSIEENSEPNVTEGKEPIILKATIKISKLKKGIKYIVLRYDSYKNIPTNMIQLNIAQKTIVFAAELSQHILFDEILSNSSVFYRCVEELTIK